MIDSVERMPMRALVTAAALLLAIGATPAMARDYAWCARTPVNGGNPQCLFTSFGQCQATVSGQGGDCIENPRIGFGQGRGWSGGRSPDNWQDSGWQDNGWRDDGRQYNGGWNNRRW
jgi:Protein of unknown function (DUF3551)